MPEPLSRRVLRTFEDVCAGWGTLAKIARALEDEGLTATASDELAPETRRGTFAYYTAGCNLADPDEVRRLLRAFETILSWVPETEEVYPPGSSFDAAPHLEEHSDRRRIRKDLARDGYDIDGNGRIIPTAMSALAQLPLEELRDPLAIREHLDRLGGAAASDPPLAISSAKSLVEATCKLVLEELGETYDDRADLPVLARAVQKGLKVRPDEIAPTAKGRETIVRTLSNLAQVVTGLAELRNEYGPDHGRTRSSSGLRARHAHLAVGAAQTFCRFLLETLRDQRAARTDA